VVSEQPVSPVVQAELPVLREQVPAQVEIVSPVVPLEPVSVSEFV